MINNNLKLIDIEKDQQDQSTGLPNYQLYNAFSYNAFRLNYVLGIMGINKAIDPIIKQLYIKNVNQFLQSLKKYENLNDESYKIIVNQMFSDYGANNTDELDAIIQKYKDKEPNNKDHPSYHLNNLIKQYQVIMILFFSPILKEIPASCNNFFNNFFNRNSDEPSCDDDHSMLLTMAFVSILMFSEKIGDFLTYLKNYTFVEDGQTNFDNIHIKLKELNIVQLLKMIFIDLSEIAQDNDNQEIEKATLKINSSIQQCIRSYNIEISEFQEEFLEKVVYLRKDINKDNIIDIHNSLLNQ